MVKLGANSVLFAGCDLETAMRYIAWAGYDGVELAAIKGMCEHLQLDSYAAQVRPIRELSEKYGLELLAMEEAALNEDRLMRAYDAAAALDIPVVNIGPGGKSGVEEDFQARTELIAKMADKAVEYGVKLCVKAHVGQCIYDTPHHPQGHARHRLSGVRGRHGPQPHLPRRRGPGGGAQGGAGPGRPRPTSATASAAMSRGRERPRCRAAAAAA